MQIEIPVLGVTYVIGAKGQERDDKAAAYSNGKKDEERQR